MHEMDNESVGIRKVDLNFGALERNKLNVKQNTKENQLQFYTISLMKHFSHISHEPNM